MGILYLEDFTPEQGLIKVRTNTLNQNGEVVQTSVGNLVVPCRPAS